MLVISAPCRMDVQTGIVFIQLIGSNDRQMFGRILARSFSLSLSVLLDSGPMCQKLLQKNIDEMIK